jgi:5-methylcytosine-specific restriction endonuclease McrA
MKNTTEVSITYFIPNIILVGAGRTQTFQHECLSCKTHFFCHSDIKDLEDLFCSDCKPNEKNLSEENISDVNYFGNVVGWKQIVANFYDKTHVSRRNYRKVYERDSYTCQYCGFNLSQADEFRALHIDHIKPRSAAGSNSMNNLCVSCEKCNCLVNDKWFKDFNDKKEYILNTIKYKNNNAKN